MNLTPWEVLSVQDTATSTVKLIVKRTVIDGNPLVVLGFGHQRDEVWVFSPDYPLHVAQALPPGYDPPVEE